MEISYSKKPSYLCTGNLHLRWIFYFLGKVSLYEERLEECTCKQVEKVKTELRNRISGLEKEVTNFKESVDEKLVGVNCAPSEGVSDLRTEMGNLKKEVEELDVGLTRDLNIMDQDFESRYKSVDEKMNSMKNDINQEHMGKFSILEKKIEDLRKELERSASQRVETIKMMTTTTASILTTHLNMQTL